ncbi:MAG: NUDIX domain-containing protein [Anaerolineales bacterium]|nr:NUDIX domain-containing protein [Anaerolineales bacterium]
MNWKYRLLYLAARCYWRIFHPITLGVKILLIKDGQVWLVKHSYQHGWFLPGGGVKRNEDLETAVRREAREELGAELGEVYLFGTYSAITELKNDHVVVFYCHDFTVGQADKAEILAVRPYPLDQLPADVSRGTRRRITEYVTGGRREQSGVW